MSPSVPLPDVLRDRLEQPSAPSYWDRLAGLFSAGPGLEGPPPDPSGQSAAVLDAARRWYEWRRGIAEDPEALASAGVGGVLGPAGRYPLTAQGMDLTMRGGKAVGTESLHAGRSKIRPGRRPVTAGERRGSYVMRDLGPAERKIIDDLRAEFERTAPEGASFKVLGGFLGGDRVLSRATPDEASMRAMTKVLEFLRGKNAVEAPTVSWKAQPGTAEAFGVRPPPNARDWYDRIYRGYTGGPVE